LATSKEAAALATLLRRTIADDRYPLSPRVRVMTWRHLAQGRAAGGTALRRITERDPGHQPWPPNENS
jgi:hypothetical protein